MIGALLALASVIGPLAGGELRIQVIDARTGEPVAGAEVHARFVTSEAARRSVAGWGQEGMSLTDFEARVRAEGERVVADASGRVVLATQAPGAEVELVARAPGFFGAQVAAAYEETRLELYADFELRVRTVDESGDPVAGVPVCLRRRKGPNDDALSSVDSDADGVAVIPHAGYLRERAFAGGTATSTHVALDLCLERAVSVEVGGPRAEPIELVVPPTGTLEVSFAGLESSVAAGGGLVRLARADGRAERFLDWELLTYRPPGCVSAQVVEGRALFRHVGLGLELALSGRLNAPSPPRRATCAGPEETGQVVEVPLALDQACATLEGRLVDPQGTAVANALVGVLPAFVPRASTLAGEWTGPEFLRTDAGGRFLFDCEIYDGFVDGRNEFDSAGGERRWLVELQALRADGASMATRIEWEPLVAGEAHALGDVLVQGEVLVAHGRVLDSSRDPIRGAEVELGWGLDFFLEEGEENPDAGVVATDDAGRFELRAMSWVLPEHLSVSGLGFETRRVDVVPPARGEMEVVLWRPGWVEGRVELPLRANPKQLEVQVVQDPRPDDPSGVPVEEQGAIRLSWSGAFATLDISPGPAKLRVLYEERELATVPIQIEEGKPTEVVLDLAMFAPLTTLELRDEQGRRVQRGAYLVREAGANSTDDLWRAPRLDHFDAGALALGWRQAPFDVLVAASGYRLARFEVGAETRELVLTPAFELALQLDPPPRKFEASERLTVVLLAPRALAPKGADMIALSISSTVFDAEGRAVVAVPGDGAYRLQLVLDGNEPGWGLSRTKWELGERVIAEQPERGTLRIVTPHELLH